MEECCTLREYAQYVAKVRKYTKEMKLDEAVEQAVGECIQEGILVEFLRRNKSEVIAMSIFEYNKEEEERKWKESVYELARAEVLAEGREEGRKEGIKEGIKENKLSVAKKLSEEGISLDIIKKVTNLSDDDIKALK